MSAIVSSCDQHGGGRRREGTATVTLDEDRICDGLVEKSRVDGEKVAIVVGITE